MKKKPGTALMLFRRDLRLDDNPALCAAMQFANVLAVFIDSPQNSSEWPIGGASKWWLHHSLISLQKKLQNFGSDLLILKGDRDEKISKLIKKYDVKAIFWNRLYEPFHIQKDKILKENCRAMNLTVQSFNGSLLSEPWQILKSDQTPYLVYTAYWNAFLKLGKVNLPQCDVAVSPLPGQFLAELSVPDLNLLPKIKWDSEFSDFWQPGEEAGKQLLVDFLDSKIDAYDSNRNIPNLSGTSRLSPYLHFGELSPQTVWHAVLQKFGDLKDIKNKDVVQFAKELVWRDFSYYLLFHFPHLDRQPLRKEYNKFPWLNEDDKLKAWQQGKTGYPIVDAGMRELWRTGWMHNRVRMIVASFLIKDLLISWQKGAEWFWDTLVDADLASNTQGWQWTAGSGADAAPYFRIFNPTLQSEKFDPEGAYIKRWVPELRNLNSQWIHEPGEAPEVELQSAGLKLGKDYPFPIVEHQHAKIRAMQALNKMKSLAPRKNN